jgi:ribosomal protein L37AE/L43A
MHCPTCHRAIASRLGAEHLSLMDTAHRAMSSQHAPCPDCGFPTAKRMLEEIGACESCRKKALREQRVQPRRIYMKRIVAMIGLCLVCVLSAGIATAQGATVGANCAISWPSNTESDLASYRLYGTLQPSVGNVLSRTIDIPKPAVAAPTVSTTCAAIGLQTGGALTLQVDAVDTLGNRSAKSLASVNTQDVSPPAQPGAITVTPSP